MEYVDPCRLESKATVTSKERDWIEPSFGEVTKTLSTLTIPCSFRISRIPNSRRSDAKELREDSVSKVQQKV